MLRVSWRIRSVPALIETRTQDCHEVPSGRCHLHSLHTSCGFLRQVFLAGSTGKGVNEV